MIKKTSSNEPCGRDSENIIGVFLKSFTIYFLMHWYTGNQFTMLMSKMVTAIIEVPLATCIHWTFYQQKIKDSDCMENDYEKQIKFSK